MKQSLFKSLGINQKGWKSVSTVTILLIESYIVTSQLSHSRTTQEHLKSVVSNSTACIILFNKPFSDLLGEFVSGIVINQWIELVLYTTVTWDTLSLCFDIKDFFVIFFFFVKKVTCVAQLLICKSNKRSKIPNGGSTFYNIENWNCRISWKNPRHVQLYTLIEMVCSP